MKQNPYAVPDWRHWLRRKIVWLLVFKLAALIALWLLFFGPAHRPTVTTDTMTERLAPPTPAEHEEPDDV